MIWAARLAFPAPAEKPAGLADSAVLAAVTGALRLRVLGETVTGRQPQARAGQVVRADRAAPRAQLGGPARHDLRSFPG